MEDGDGQIDFKVEAALIDKAGPFKTTVNIPTLKRLVDASLSCHAKGPR